MSTRKLGFAGRIAHYFINSKLTPLIMVFSILLGAFAVLQTPREEEPQIVVPMMDVFVEMPGSTAQEVEQRVTTPMEKLIWEIPGVEYIYSTTRPGLGMAIVRFKVGEKEEDSIIKLYNKLYSHFDLIPPGASKPIIKPRSIDDVPILALTFWSNRYDSYTLRRVASEVDREIKSIDDVSQTQVIGGERRQVRVLLNPGRTAGHGVAPAALMGSIDRANQRLQVGEFASANQEYNVETGDFLRNADEVGRVVVGVSSGRPVYLRDVAEVLDGPEEPTNYVLFGYGSGAKVKSASAMGESPAVTLTVSKRKGQNAVTVAKRVMEKVESLKGTLIPAGVEVTVTRNYGATAQEKSNELLQHLLLAVLSVTLLIALALGWRSSMVVLAAVPVTLALTLFIYFIYGYTLNRVTLFALIFSIGILVDDAIVVVENITRHFHLPENKGRPLADVAVEAVDEVGNPTTLATWTVIAAILPMAFVGGLMGPLHAAHSHWRVTRHVVLALHCLRDFSLGSVANARERKSRSRGWRRGAGRLDNPCLPAADDAPARRCSQAHHFPGGRGAPSATGVHPSASKDCTRQDASLRQQERVPSDHRHAGRDDTRTDGASGT